MTSDIERKLELHRERNRRYLAKNDPDVKARRSAASKAYRARLKNDPAYAERAKEIRREAVARTARWQAKNLKRLKLTQKQLVSGILKSRLRRFNAGTH
jgi:uncharacterized membrane-anchored protein YjiN (DUF445 family)